MAAAVCRSRGTLGPSQLALFCVGKGFTVKQNIKKEAEVRADCLHSFKCFFLALTSFYGVLRCYAMSSP